jgi:hypothetical protein
VIVTWFPSLYIWDTVHFIWERRSLTLCHLLTNTSMMVILHWGDQCLSHNFHISSIEVNCSTKFKQFANQDQILIAKLHSKKMWKAASTWMLQKLHIEGKTHPLIIRLSSVGTLLCTSLQTRRDFEGGISGF